MAQLKEPVEQMVSCEVCLKEVPVSAARSAEAGDSVAYFCGIECYVTWKEQEARGDEGGKGA
jgi:hypothetical protein